MNFFGFFGSSTPAETPKKEDNKETDQNDTAEQQDDDTNEEDPDPSKLSKLGDDKIFSNVDSYTGELMSNHYTPPNLFINKNTGSKFASSSGFKIDPSKYKTEPKPEQFDDFNKEIQAMHNFERYDSLKVHQNSQYGRADITELSNNLFGLTSTESKREGIFHSAIIPDYVANIAENDFDDLTKDAEKLKTASELNLMRSAIDPSKNKSTYINEVSTNNISEIYIRNHSIFLLITFL